MCDVYSSIKMQRSLHESDCEPTILTFLYISKSEHFEKSVSHFQARPAMPRISDPWKAALMTECVSKKLSDQGSIETLQTRLQKRVNRIHKRKNNVGRPPSAVKMLVLKLLKRKKLGETGSVEMLIDRFKKSSNKKYKKATAVTNILNINKVYVSADELHELLNLRAGDKVRFSNGAKKMLVECSTGGYRWKTI